MSSKEPRLIDANALETSMIETIARMMVTKRWMRRDKDNEDEILNVIREAPTIEAVPVVRCKDCVYFRERHVLLADGTERDYATGEEWFAATVGINVGSQCRREEEPCFRNGCDFCSRGLRKEDAP